MRFTGVYAVKLPDRDPAPEPLEQTMSQATLTCWSGAACTCTRMRRGCQALPEATQMAYCPEAVQLPAWCTVELVMDGTGLAAAGPVLSATDAAARAGADAAARMILMAFMMMSFW